MLFSGTFGLENPMNCFGFFTFHVDLLVTIGLQWLHQSRLYVSNWHSDCDIFLSFLWPNQSSFQFCMTIMAASLDEGEFDEEFQGAIPTGRGLSTMTRPTT